MKQITVLGVMVGITIGVALCVLAILVARWMSPDPVAPLKTLLARIEKEGTKERCCNIKRAMYQEQTNSRGQWWKRKLAAEDIRFDVRKTDSITSPIVASVTWYSYERRSGYFDTSEQAKNAEITGNKFMPRFGHWEATLAFNKGAWAVTDIQTDSKIDLLDLDAYEDMHEDWQQAFSAD